MILLPVLFWLERIDRSEVSPRSSKYLWGSLVFATLLYLGIRSISLGEEPHLYPYPYFFSPFEVGFARRTIALLSDYLIAFVTGHSVNPMRLDPIGFWSSVDLVELGISLSVLAYFIYLSLINRTARWFLAIIFISILPITVLYNSARYLYLPSFAWFGLLALGAEHCSRTLIGRGVSIVVLLIVIPLSAWRLYFQSEHYAKHRGEELEMPLRSSLTPIIKQNLNAKAIYILDFPYEWLGYQFMQDMFEVEFNRALPRLRVLSIRRDKLSPETVMIREDSERLLLSRSSGALCQRSFINDFRQRACVVGEQIAESDYEVRIDKCDEDLVSSIELEFSSKSKIERAIVNYSTEGRATAKSAFSY